MGWHNLCLSQICGLLILLALGGTFAEMASRFCYGGTQPPWGALQCPAQPDGIDATFCCGTCTMPYCCSSVEARLDPDSCFSGDAIHPLALEAETPSEKSSSFAAIWFMIGLTLTVVAIIAVAYICKNPWHCRHCWRLCVFCLDICIRLCTWLGCISEEEQLAQLGNAGNPSPLVYHSAEAVSHHASDPRPTLYHSAEAVSHYASDPRPTVYHSAEAVRHHASDPTLDVPPYSTFNPPCYSSCQSMSPLFDAVGPLGISPDVLFQTEDPTSLEDDCVILSPASLCDRTIGGLVSEPVLPMDPPVSQGETERSTSETAGHAEEL